MVRFSEESRVRRILVVDDEVAVLELVRLTLEKDGFEIATARSAGDALKWVDANGLPHLAIVDIRMPGMNGVELGRRLREYSDLPIIMLTAVQSEATVVEVIEQVAEDFVRKPFSVKELTARVKRVLARASESIYVAGQVTKIDDKLRIDFTHQKAVSARGPVDLTPTESKILHILVQRAPRTVTTDFLLDRVWPSGEVFEDSLRVHVHRLRKKIEPDLAKPRYIFTRRGVGYGFSPVSSVQAG